MVARLPVACELADRPGLEGRPVVVVDEGRVLSASPAAEVGGVREGQRVSEATGYCPSLVALEARPARYEESNEAMLEALERVAPKVEPAGPGVAYVDLAGLARSSGGAESLHAGLLACVPSALRPCLGVGPTKFVALLAASRLAEDTERFRGRSSARRDRHAPPEPSKVVGDGERAAFLAPVKVEALPAPAEVVRRLRLVGITTVGELARLPRQGLVAQFGAEGSRLASLLEGEAEPVRPRPRLELLRERLVLTEPLTSRPAVLAAAAHLLGRVLRQPGRRDRVARRAAVQVATEQGKRWEATVTLREPRGDHEGVWAALAPVLERAELPGPVCELSVELHGLRPQRGWQGELPGSSRAARAARWQRVEESVRQLQARYGHSPVGRIVPVEPWNRIPERRWALIELD